MKKYCKKDYGEWVQYAGMFAARRQPAVKRSDVSINQIPSKANPHPGAALRVSGMAYLHSLRQCPLIQNNLETYLFSLLWASTHTKLTVPTPENWGFQKRFPEWIILRSGEGKPSFSKHLTASQRSATCNCSFCMLIQLIWSQSAGVFIDIFLFLFSSNCKSIKYRFNWRSLCRRPGIIISMGEQVAFTHDNRNIL